MKKLLKGILFSVSFVALTSFSVITDWVYICNGPYSKKYHLIEDCRGLNRCSTNIEKVTLDKAKAKGRTLCGWED